MYGFYRMDVPMKLLFLWKMSVVIALLLLLIPAAACSRQNAPGIQSADLQDEMISERIARDEAFKKGANSPIPEQERESFQGLKYYPVNQSLRYSVKLNRYSRPENVRLSTNTGEIRSGLRYGYFEFKVEGQTCRLQVYRLDDTTGSGGPNLFIPFRDATSGKETYASGRYIDLEENTTGIYDLDFNRAYNPYCAFNSKYSCPLPPSENNLPVSIEAGEKKYEKSGEKE